MDVSGGQVTIYTDPDPPRPIPAFGIELEAYSGPVVEVHYEGFELQGSEQVCYGACEHMGWGMGMPVYPLHHAWHTCTCTRPFRKLHYLLIACGIHGMLELSRRPKLMHVMKRSAQVRCMPFALLRLLADAPCLHHLCGLGPDTAQLLL